VIAVLTTAAVGILSAFVPFTPVEPYLIAAAATTGAAPIILGIAAAAGQTTGKVIIFLAARGAIHSPWLQGRLSSVRRPAVRRPAVRRPAVRRPAVRRPAVDPPGRVSTLLARPKAVTGRLLRSLSRPRLATPVLLVSAVTGFPPLLVASVYLARTPMRLAVFSATCMLGRTLRFVTVALAPGLVGY
jgi:membrane protein YqaA with SNARE-associated domain